MKMMDDLTRIQLRAVLNEFAEDCRNRRFRESQLQAVASYVFNLVPDADVMSSTRWLAFTSSKGDRYYASAAGLWRWSDRGQLVSVNEWWVALLNTHAYSVRSRRLFDRMESEFSAVGIPPVGG